MTDPSCTLLTPLNDLTIRFTQIANTHHVVAFCDDIVLCKMHTCHGSSQSLWREAITSHVTLEDGGMMTNCITNTICENTGTLLMSCLDSQACQVCHEWAPAILARYLWERWHLVAAQLSVVASFIVVVDTHTCMNHWCCICVLHMASSR